MRLGDYEVEGEIGRGGGGVVLRARAAGGRLVAIKVLEGPRSAEAIARFDRERRLLSSLAEKDGFVPLLDVGTSNRGPYLVMPFVPGGTLRERIVRGTLGIPETIALGERLARALGRAHAVGIVHRDVKPENVLFTGEGAPLVADMGLAKHFRADAPGASASVHLSRTDTWRGSVGYMAPEQIAGAKLVGPPADVFALGAVLYECLAGVPAFPGESIQAVLEKLEQCRPAPLRNLAPGVPARLALVIERALARDPARRFPDGDALARALGQGAPGRSRRGPVLGACALAVGAAAFLLAMRSREPLAFVELEPRAGETQVLATPELLVRGRLSDASAGPVHFEGATPSEAVPDAQGRFEARLRFDPGTAAVEVRAGTGPRSVLSRIPVEVDLDPPAVAIDTIYPVPGGDLSVACRVRDAHPRLARFSVVRADGALVAGPTERALGKDGRAAVSLARPPGDGLSVRVEAEDATGRKGVALAPLPPRLPAELRLGARETLRDGTEVPLYLRLLPGDGGVLELVYVPPGDFVMGVDPANDATLDPTERPKHVHPMDHGYWIGRCHVTWHQYLAFCAATGRKAPRRPEWAKDDHPVVLVSWEDARSFCAWAGLALATEAEWEKAARGSDGRLFPWGNERWDGTQANLCDVSILSYPQIAAPFLKNGWVDQEVNDGYAFTAPVGSFKAGASPWGALDMSGNAWQWCEDVHEENAYTRYVAGDFSPPKAGPARVVRGGGWFNYPNDVRTAHRGAGATDMRAEGIGFRVVLR